MNDEQRKEFNIHCGRCGGVKDCPGVVHESEIQKIDDLLKTQREEILEKIKEKSWIDDPYRDGYASRLVDFSDIEEVLDSLQVKGTKK